jgi:integrase/recombinase XerD
MNKVYPVGQTGTSGRGATQWDAVIASFLEEKRRRSGSARKAESYASIIRHFNAACGKAPGAVSPYDVSAFAAGTSESGKAPSPATAAARITARSSSFRYLRRPGLIERDPCDLVAKPRQAAPTTRGLSADEIRRLLAAVPGTADCLSDRAILVFMLLTGRRRSEALGLRAGSIEPVDLAFYTYRGKGGVTGRRELPEPALRALAEALAVAGRDLSTMAPDEPVWIAGTGRPGGSRPLSGSSFYSSFRRYLAKAGLPSMGLHALRHTAAKLRREAGATVEEVGSFLDHSSLAVTTVYLRRIEGDRDAAWRGVADCIGLQRGPSGESDADEL